MQGERITIRITAYYNGVPTYDSDNISKPIVDALKGIAYVDDSQVIDRIARKRALGGAYRIKGVPPELAVAIAEGDDFVSIEINELSREEAENLL